MQFNGSLLPSHPHVPHAELRRGAADDFDEHVAAIDRCYDRIPEVIAPIEQRLREELCRALGEDWCARCRGASRIMSIYPVR